MKRGSPMPTNDGNDTIRVVRVGGIFDADEAAAMAKLNQEVASHAAKHTHREFRLEDDRQLSHMEAAGISDRLGTVGGYRSVYFQDMLDREPDKFLQFLNDLLTEADLDDVEYEGVWTVGGVVVLYITGVLREDAEE